jgi:cytochrome c oxidase cbb3-type subunit 3
MTNGIRFCLLFLVFGGLMSAVAFQESTAPSGKSIFKRRCMMCHGADGKGYETIKTPDFTDSNWQASVKDQDILDAIKNGKKGTKMPAFGDKLSGDEIKAVTGFVRSFNSVKK